MVDLGALLEESGAILRGHFVLSSGRHSDVYFEKFRVLERPDVLSALVAEMLAQLGDVQIDRVAGPTTGGIIIAHEAARQLGVPALYVESENGVKTIRRNATVKPGTRFLVVDDVLTTGLSVRETIDVVAEAGGEVVAAAVLIDRASQPLSWPCPMAAAYRVDAETWAADELPPHLRDVPVTKPGTRPGV